MFRKHRPCPPVWNGSLLAPLASVTAPCQDLSLVVSAPWHGGSCLEGMDSPEPGEAFSSISSLYPLDGGSIPYPQQVMTTDKSAECSQAGRVIRATVLFGRSTAKGTEPQSGKMFPWLGQSETGSHLSVLPPTPTPTPTQLSAAGKWRLSAYQRSELVGLLCT